MNRIQEFAERNGLIPLSPRYKNEPELQPNAQTMFGVGAAKLRDSKNLRNY